MSATALRIVLQPGRAETLHAGRLFTVAMWPAVLGLRSWVYTNQAQQDPVPPRGQDHRAACEIGQ